MALLAAVLWLAGQVACGAAAANTAPVEDQVIVERDVIRIITTGRTYLDCQRKLHNTQVGIGVNKWIVKYVEGRGLEGIAHLEAMREDLQRVQVQEQRRQSSDDLVVCESTVEIDPAFRRIIDRRIEAQLVRPRLVRLGATTGGVVLVASVLFVYLQWSERRRGKAP